MKTVWPSLIFNLSNEPAFKFNLSVFGDKSSAPESRTSYLLESQVMYLETQTERFELSKKAENLYSFCKVSEPQKKDNEYMSKAIIPLP